MVCCDRFFILLSHNPAPRITSQNRTISQKALSLLPYERSVGFASLRNSGRSTSGIHARPLSKVRCCRRKNSGDYRRDCHTTHCHSTNPSKNRTISLAFRRVSVCVRLVGFASLQSPWAHTLRHPCLACSSRCTEYCHSHNNCKKTIIPRPTPTLPNPYYPSKIANTLASLVKGRWIDGKAQTVALLRLNCDTPALFITKPFCRQDGGIATLTVPFPLL